MKKIGHGYFTVCHQQEQIFYVLFSLIIMGPLFCLMEWMSELLTWAMSWKRKMVMVMTRGTKSEMSTKNVYSFYYCRLQRGSRAVELDDSQNDEEEGDSTSLLYFFVSPYESEPVQQKLLYTNTYIIHCTPTRATFLGWCSSFLMIIFLRESYFPLSLCAGVLSPHMHKYTTQHVPFRYQWKFYLQ